MRIGLFKAAIPRYLQPHHYVFLPSDSHEDDAGCDVQAAHSTGAARVHLRPPQARQHAWRALLTRGCVSRAASVCPLRLFPLAPRAQFSAEGKESTRTCALRLCGVVGFLLIFHAGPSRRALGSLEERWALSKRGIPILTRQGTWG